MSDAFSGVGAQFKRGDGASAEAFIALTEVNSIQGPNKTRDTIDVTSLDSTDGYREFIAGFRDGGEVVLNMNFTRVGFDTLNDDFESNDSVNYQIVLPDTGGTIFDLTGYVTNVAMAIPMDDKVTMDITIKITGPVTLTT
ncbi:hypothetical protein LCGC14_0717700 [marine sediment metagenome]|uniref:Lambda phage tail tube protein N-terminal domain-containing protein n=1 Tax=marine sediment metagenome TaxID=412755 RepID=A0A0F9QDA6_9ZZZZ